MKPTSFLHSMLPAVLGSFCLGASPAAAAQIMGPGGTHFDCAAVVAGEIVQGDLRQIQQLGLARFRDGAPLCFDSPGGALSEALLIGDHLRTQGIASAVDAGSSCIGACAFAFLGGSAQGFGTGLTADRRLHLDGTLKFPALTETLSDGATPTGTPISARLQRFDLPPDFAAQIFALGQGESLAITRIEQARSLDLTLAGVAPAGSLGDTVVTRACIQTSEDFDPSLSRPAQPIHAHRVVRERGATAHRNATYVVEAVRDGVPSWIACQTEMQGDSPAVVKLRISQDWTAGGDPLLRDVHLSLLPQPWRDVPVDDVWRDLPGDMPLSEARQAAVSETSTSVLVDPIGPLPATTAGIEALLELRNPDRREIQQRLTLLDYDTIGVDGIFGPGSRDAIAAWQEQAGFDPTGFLDATQKAALFQESAGVYLTWQDEQRRIEAEKAAAAAAAAAAPRYIPPPETFAPTPAPAPQGQRVRVCNRSFTGELINCRIEFR